jgi:DNA-binding transcriptional regulator/RsmH inhibitor MraZ
MTPREFEQVAEKLGELEDYLRAQARLARAVGRGAEAAVMDTALRMAIAAHAQAQLLMEEAR